MVFENAVIVASQVLILFLLIGIGYLTSKMRLINEVGTQQMTNLLLIIVTPCIIISSFQMPFNTSLLWGILISSASALATHALGAVIAKLIFRRYPDARRKVFEFAVVFSNCGFMCIPLLNAVLGQQGVFYGSFYIAVFNIAQWTYGIILMADNRREISIRRALINPGTIALLVALPLFLAGISLPPILSTVIDSLAALNTPLAMIIIGSQMAAANLRSLFRDRQVFLAVAFRLLVIPGLMMIPLSLIPMSREVALACLIPAAAPTAAVTALFATRYRQDAGLASQIIALSTLASIISIPLLIMVFDFFA
ncbi:MAG: AEC family transporter [Clostridiaceae bacterium]|nr:AEC family transporter [Clostridiaceae bacterium]